MITPEPFGCYHKKCTTKATCLLFVKTPDFMGLPPFFPYCDEHRPVLRTNPPPPATTYIEELR